MAELGGETRGEAVEELMESLDSDGSGMIEFREFLDWWHNIGMRQVRSRLDDISAASRRYLGRISGPFPQVFSRFDDDGSGSIEIGEFGELLGALGIHLTDAETAHALELLDPNGDGSISWEAARSSRLGLLHSSYAVLYESAGEIPREICPLSPPDAPASPQEYLAWWSRFDIQHIFDQYDADGSGSISVTELQLLCGDLGVTLSRREVRAPAASAP